MLRFEPAGCEEAGASRHVLEDELLRELPGLDLLEDLLHLRLGLVGDDTRAAGVVAVLGGVADRVAHIGEAAFVDQVHDQLQFVHRLEECALLLVAGLDQCFEGGLDQGRKAAAKDHLLAEEVRLALFAEGCLKHAGAGAADSLGVGQGDLVSNLRGVLVDGDQTRHAAAFGEHAADEMARALGRNHRDVNKWRRIDLLEVDIEAVREHQHLAFGQVRLHALLVDSFLHMVRGKHHDDVRFFGRLLHVDNPQTLLFSELPGLGAGVEADHDIAAAVLQVQGMGVSLRAEADDRDLAPVQQ